jgi:RimJ/RimL family protein N-acetyltransferase
MTAVLRSLLQAWISMMNTHHIRVSVFDDNIGNRRVLEKNGFKMYAIVKEALIIRAKGEIQARKPTLHVLDWIGPE